MRNVWMVPVFVVLLMGFGRCNWWWPPPGGGDGDGSCRKDRDCVGAGTCVDGSCECSGALVLCAPGTVFNEDPMVCECEPVEPPFCGGIAGIACPGAGMCVDDASDDCDPEDGGADCGGICECNAAAISCPVGTWLNDDPAVCECLPIEGGEPCGEVTCGEGLVCCNESCGICTEPGGSCTKELCVEPGPECGGFIGLACPGEGECVDDPSDDCDPANGGADCSGSCECNVGPVIDCVPGDTFDASPFVCACVPPEGGEPCGDVTCGTGLVCCNESCGICTPPDGVCIQIACE